MLSFQPLDGPFGVRAEGKALNQLDQHDINLLIKTWQRHPLVLFQQQTPGEAELVEFSRHFGELERFERDGIYRPVNPEILYVSNLTTEDGQRLGNLGSAELAWHTDQSYRERPATGAVFHAILVPEQRERNSSRS